MQGVSYHRTLLVIAVVLACFAAWSYALAFVPSGMIQSLIVSNAVLGVALAVATLEYYRSGDVFHPSVLMLVMMAAVSLSLVYSVASGGTGGRFATNNTVWSKDFVRYVTLVFIVLSGYYVGVRLGMSNSLAVAIRKRDFGLPPVTSFFMASLVAVLATGGQLAAIVQKGGISYLLSQYGAGQYIYDTSYHLRVFGLAAFFPAFGIMAVSYLARPRRGKLAIIIILSAAYVLPQILYGDRSPLIYCILIWLIALNYVKVRIRPKYIAGLLAAGALYMSLFGIWRNDRSFEYREMGDLFGHTVEDMLYTSAGTAGVIMQVESMFPDDHPFMWGETYLHALGNVVPSFLFEDDRPFVIASLKFRELFAPHMVGHGFGYSLVAEAYMNFGLLLSFFPGVVIGLIGGSAYSWMRYRPSMSRVAVYALLYCQLLWYIRGDAAAFVKSMAYGYAALMIICCMSDLVASKRRR